MQKFKLFQLLIASVLFLLCSSSWSTNWVLPRDSQLIGEIQWVHPEFGETLYEVGIRYNIGFYEMIRANPLVSSNQPLPPATRLVIPSQFILPPGPHKGLVINLAEYRLYYFPPNENVVVTMPVGIGREGWTTPLGVTKVTQKERDPQWRPTAKLRAEAEKIGALIPEVFPSGDGNPLGRRILRLGWPTYLIHGANRREGIGTRISAGCIRVLPEDIEYLFELVSIGTPVRVINAPIKISHQKNSLYVQVYPLLKEHKNKNLAVLAEAYLTDLGFTNVKSKLLLAELQNPTGLVKKIK